MQITKQTTYNLTLSYDEIVSIINLHLSCESEGLSTTGSDELIDELKRTIRDD